MADAVPPFHWSQINHSLVALKLTSIAGDMRDFPAGTDPESIRRRTDEHVQRVYAAYCEVWVDLQRGQKSPAFILAVLQQAIIPLIAGARAGRIGELNLQEVRTRRVGRTATLQAEIGRTLERLATKWRRKLEIEARECAYAPKPTLAVAASDMAVEAKQGAWADDLIPPDDPRHQSWLIIKAFLLSEENSAKAELWKSFEKNGTLELNDVLRFFDRVFNSAAKSLVITVKGTHSAQQSNADLDELLKRVLEQFEGLFEKAPQAIGVAASTLKKEVEIRLNTRLCEWKAEAFRLGLQGQLANHGAYLANPEKRSGGERAPLAKTKHNRPPLQRYKSGLKRAIANALVKNPNASALELCRSIDEDGTTELDGKDRTLEAGYMDPKRRPKLETTISKVRRDLRERGLL